jgi:hypothetical protein
MIVLPDLELHWAGRDGRVVGASVLIAKENQYARLDQPRFGRERLRAGRIPGRTPSGGQNSRAVAGW